MSDEPREGRFGPKSLLNSVHKRVVFTRRVRILSRHIARAIPDGGRVLDLGSGDGSIALALMRLRNDLQVEGVDVLIRPETLIPVIKIDGDVLPFEDCSFDYVTIIDVLHHTSDPAAVLAEARRVARKGVLLKDHLLEGIGARPTLRLMDWVGNRGHNVALPYNYLSRNRWDAAFLRAGLEQVSWLGKLRLYPAPANLLFDRRLHFIALMAPARKQGHRDA
jgi:SAM-dependent methyltransferase